jgi:hypothetical protein
LYVESFVFCVAAPVIRSGTIVLDAVADGVFVAPGFPVRLEFGGLLEFALEEDDEPGDYEIELALEYSRLQGAPQTPLGQSFVVRAVEPGEDWWGPRLVQQPLELGLRVWDEFEGYLVVKINGEETTARALRVVHYAVPAGV